MRNIFIDFIYMHAKKNYTQLFCVHNRRYFLSKMLKNIKKC
jgi:hypothetical protein